MPAYPRKLQKVFASALTPSSNVAVPGSTVTGTPIYSNDPLVIQSLAAFQNGFNGMLITGPNGPRSPVQEELNALFLLLTQQVAYVLQSGVPEWDADTTYYRNQYCRIGKDKFISLSDNNSGNNPATDTNNWAPETALLTGPCVAAAWVEFDGINVDSGGNSTVHSSFNVDHVHKNADGNYTIFFSNALPSSHYSLSGSCGSEDGQTAGSGDMGRVVGNAVGQGPAIRSATACRVFTLDNTNALVTSGNVSVIFFGR